MKLNLPYCLLYTLILWGSTIVAQDTDLNLASAELTKLAAAKNYTPTDIANAIISDDYISGGVRHIYYQQSIDQIGIYGTSASVHIKDGQVIASNLHFLPQLGKRNIQSQFQVQALEAVARLALDKGYPLSQTELLILEADDTAPNRATTVSSAGISNRTIPLKLVYFINEQEEVQLAWNLFIDEVADAEYINYVVDASTGTILLEKDLTVRCTFDHDHDHATSCNNNAVAHFGHKKMPSTNRFNQSNTDSTYTVFKYDVESPNFGVRTAEVNPWTNVTASPNGWHQIGSTNYEYTLGNNVDAYDDRDNSNGPTGGNAARAFGGSNLVFNQTYNPNDPPTSYTKAAIVNLFYTNNIAHDVFYNYGFDEVSGNFQEDNFNKGGSGSDYVMAEAQDGLGTCNARMTTPADGSKPRMQMFLCGNRDGDFDNAIILHEFGHGVSNRLTGGPNAVTCLGNSEQMGEGWSDFFGMVFTMQPNHVATTQRTIGTFLFNQDANGPGLRPYPYTTDMAINPMTYRTVEEDSISRPHGIGAVWATMLWDLNWALIDQYGWNPNIYDGASTISNSTGGNNISLRLVMEGLRLQPCAPGFVDGRDAILAADQALYGGIHQCLIWEVFARRGLGYSAEQGSTNSRDDGVESFDLPSSCTVELRHTANRNTAYLGERLTFELTAINHLDALVTNVIVTDTIPENVQFYSATNGATVNGNVVQWPAFNLPANDSMKLELTVQVNDTINYEEDFLDDLESGDGNWQQVQLLGNNAWALQSTYRYSPVSAWFIPNATNTTETHLVLKDPLYLTNTSELTFNHFFNLENTYDFGLVEISIDCGKTWKSLESNFTQNGYNTAVQLGYMAFSGMSVSITPNDNGYITSRADLSPYAGEVALIRFRLLTDVSAGNFGWIVDDIGISNTNYALPSFSNIRNGDYNFDTKLRNPVVINRSQVNRTVVTQSDSLFTEENAAIAFADVQANDLDEDGLLDTLTTTILVPASNGTASVANEDSISYLPNIDFFGLDTVIYQVCDELNACESDTLFIFIENLPPLTEADFATVNENSTNNLIDALANDGHPNSTETITINIAASAKHGTENVTGTNLISYTPNTDYFGQDTIVYQACDPQNLCATDTVFITVLSVNSPPTAVADYVTTNRDTANYVINVQQNDSDPDGDELVTTILTSAENGTESIIGDTSISYTPNPGFVGTDNIVYQICDIANQCAFNTVFITINDFNEGPTANADTVTVLENSINNRIDVQKNDTDPNLPNDSLITTITENPLQGIATVINQDSLSYTPTTDYFGSDRIVYQVCDTANLCSTDTVFITVLEINRAPITQPDFVDVGRNSQNIFINVQANDFDPNGASDTLVTNIVVGAVHGTSSVMNNDSLVYTPTIDYFGPDSITYEVCDIAGLCTSEKVYLTVNESFACTANDLTENDPNISDGDYIAANSITSAGTVTNNATVRFVAGNVIDLLPGFEAETGAEFTAFIEPCDNSLLLMGGIPNNSNAPLSELTVRSVQQQSTLLIRPNPFRHSTLIDYELPRESKVWIGLHDLTGKVIQVFVNQQQLPKGQHQYTLSADRLPSGTYWVTLRTGDGVLTEKVVVLH